MFRGEKLGKGKRVTIPSCVVKKIREHFPEQNGQYIGFKTAFESMQDLCNSSINLKDGTNMYHNYTLKAKEKNNHQCIPIINTTCTYSA